MNTGQSMLAICAMILLSTLTLRVNNNLLTTDEVMNESKFGVLATSLATSIIEEASKLAFDEVTIGNPVIDSSFFTSPDSLTYEDEDYTDFDDFDDFNNYTRNVTNLPSAIFDISCRAHYVRPPNIESVSLTQSWHKKITVTVTSPSSRDTLRLSSIFSYWFF